MHLILVEYSKMQKDRILSKSYKMLDDNVTTKTNGLVLCTSQCIDTDTDMFMKTRLFVV